MMGWFSRFWRKRKKVVVVRLQGAISAGGGLRPGLSAEALEERLVKAFSRKPAAVALAINCPGGSPVQSALIAKRIRQLAEEKKVPVLAYVEDVAASGGYWLATAADEIHAEAASIIGSIGVVSAGFGFTKALSKLGIERRVYSAGKNKVVLDPFQPEKPEDVARLKALQADIHELFKRQVIARRGRKLKQSDKELFTGAFWTAGKALELGLIDGIADMTGHLKTRFGADVVIERMREKQGFLARRMQLNSAGIAHDSVEALAQAAELRALWSRFGL